MSVSLQSVPRGDEQLAEVASLREAVEAWQRLEPVARETAILTLERAAIIDGAQVDRFEGEGIAALAERLGG